MAHQQTNLALSRQILTLEEAYWRVMSKIIEVEDFLQRYMTVETLITTNELKPVSYTVPSQAKLRTHN